MIRLAPLLLLMACAARTVPRETTSITEACVEGDTLRATFEECLSSSCDSLVSATCDATLVGDVVTVTGHSLVERRGDVCTMDCGFVRATCPLPDVDDPSDVTLQAGDVTLPLDEAACAG